MAEPEIARRCHFCGASLRVRGMYCPQCGNATGEPAPESPDRDRSTETEEVFDPAETVSMDLSGLPTAELHDAASVAETIRLQPLGSESAKGTPGELTTTNQPAEPTLPHEAATKPLGSATPPLSVREARMGDARRGLEKMREISTVVLDEASYDPSARFVLVAAVLFILFLIILIMSEMMR